MQQRGVALVVALALVLFSTLLGVTAMQVGTDDMRSVTSEEMQRNAFHTAESAANEIFKTVGPGTLRRTEEITLDSTSIDTKLAVEVRLRQEGLVPMVNSSLRTLAMNAYAIQSTARSADNGSVRTVVLGAAQVVPMSR